MTTSETYVSTMGMDCKLFTDDDADEVRALVGKYGLELHLHNEFGADTPYYVLTEVPESEISTADRRKIKVLILLNLDDETSWAVNDSIIPPMFNLDLCKLLASIAARHPNYEGHPVEYVMEMARKNRVVEYDPDRTTWTDYEELMKL